MSLNCGSLPISLLLLLASVHCANGISTNIDPILKNEVATSDSYSMFKHLMEVKDDMTEEQEELKPILVKTVKQALQRLLEVAFKDLTWTLRLVLLGPYWEDRSVLR